jgi:hypothetical protein
VALANQAIANFWADITTESECELEGIVKVYACYFIDEAGVQINGGAFLPDLEQIILQFGPVIQGCCKDGDVLSWHGVEISYKDCNSFVMLANEVIQDSTGIPKTQNNGCQQVPNSGQEYTFTSEGKRGRLLISNINVVTPFDNELTDCTAR